MSIAHLMGDRFARRKMVGWVVMTPRGQGTITSVVRRGGQRWAVYVEGPWSKSKPWPFDPRKVQQIT